MFWASWDRETIRAGLWCQSSALPQSGSSSWASSLRWAFRPRSQPLIECVCVSEGHIVHLQCTGRVLNLIPLGANKGAQGPLINGQEVSADVSWKSHPTAATKKEIQEMMRKPWPPLLLLNVIFTTHSLGSAPRLTQLSLFHPQSLCNNRSHFLQSRNVSLVKHCNSYKAFSHWLVFFCWYRTGEFFRCDSCYDCHNRVPQQWKIIFSHFWRLNYR